MVSPKTDPLETERLQMYKYFSSPESNKTDEGKLQVAYIKDFACGLVGEGCTDNPQDAKQNRHLSFVGGMTNLIMLPYSTAPASGIEWARTGLEHAGFIPQSQAAVGIGLAAVLPFKNLWTLFRNFAFLIMVIIMVIIGFMIMFRAKINAQTVISVENALPKIVIAMILITFSYAIAGFMIDLMYVSMGLIIHLFGTNPDLSHGFDDSGTTLSGIFNSSNPFKPANYINKVFFSDNFTLSSEIFENNVPAVAGSLYDLIPTEIRSISEQVITVVALKYGLIILGTMVSAVPFLKGAGKGIKETNLLKMIFEKSIKPGGATAGILGKIAGSAKGINFIDSLLTDTTKSGTPGISLIAAFISLIIFSLVSSLLGPLILKSIIWLVLMLSLFFVFMRIFFMFISAYIQILILIIFSPLILAVEMFPGKSAFKTWIQSLFINLLTFPLFLVIILLSKTIMVTTSQYYVDTLKGVNQTTTSLWAPPFIWGIDSTAFTTIIAGALIFMAPDLIKSFKAMTGIKPMSQAGLKFGAFFAGGTTLVGGAVGLATQFQSLRTNLFGHQAANTGIAGFVKNRSDRFLSAVKGLQPSGVDPTDPNFIGPKHP